MTNNQQHARTHSTRTSGHSQGTTNRGQKQDGNHPSLPQERAGTKTRAGRRVRPRRSIPSRPKIINICVSCTPVLYDKNVTRCGQTQDEYQCHYNDAAIQRAPELVHKDNITNAEYLSCCWYTTGRGVLWGKNATTARTKRQRPRYTAHREAGCSPNSADLCRTCLLCIPLVTTFP